MEGDRILPFYIVHALPVGVSGLLIAAVFAAAMSTLDSGIHSMSTMIVVDLVKPLSRTPLTERSSLLVARILTLGLGAVATVTALLFSGMEGVVKGIHQVSGYVGGPVAALFLLGLLTRRGHFRGWLAATLVLGLPLSYYVQNHTQVHWLLYGPVSIGTCLTAAYLLSRILGPPRSAPRDPVTIWRTQTTSGTTKGAR